MDNIRLIEVAAGMHLVLLVALVELSIMDQKEGMRVEGDIHLGCEVEEMYAQRMEILGFKKVLDM